MTSIFRKVAIAVALFVTLISIPVFAATPAIEDLPAVTNVSVGASTTATYHNGNVTVSWTGTAEALQYTVRATQVGTNTAPLVTVGSQSSKAVIEGLIGGATYVIQVRVIGNGHVSPWTASTLTATPLTLPMAPAQPLPPVPGIGSALVTWSDLSGDQDGGSPVTGYKVTEVLSNTTLVVGPTDTSATVTGLTEGSSASFTVAAVTALSPQGIASVATSPVTILSSKTTDSSSSNSKSASSQATPTPTPTQTNNGGGVMPVSSPTPIESPSPTITAVPFPSVTAQPTLPTYPTLAPSPIASLTPSPSPTPTTSTIVYTVQKNPFIKIDLAKNIAANKLQRFTSTTAKQSVSVTLGKSLAVTLPKIAKGTLVKATIKFPDGKSLTLLTMKTIKTSDVALPIVTFKQSGTYIVATSIGKVSRMITIKVPAAATSTSKITCVKSTKTIVVSGIKPVCPAGYKKK